MNVFECIKNVYWSLPLPSSMKNKFFYFIKGRVRGKQKGSLCRNDEVLAKYVEQILNVQKMSSDYAELKEGMFVRQDNYPKLIAYYLPQFYPTEYNDKWWGKGTTEWKNVAKSVPQYVGQYQPRLPGELGFYDLRIADNIRRQVELAKQSGVYGFCFYYYWFDGERLLDKPIDLFVSEKIDFPFCFCWANEDWTKQWNGVSNEVIKKQSKTVDSYKKFIDSVLPYMQDDRYISINGKKVLIVYKPENIPNMEQVFTYWQERAKSQYSNELYLIVCHNGLDSDMKSMNKYMASGADGIGDFAPGCYMQKFNKITANQKFVCDSFYGTVFDYKDFVERKLYGSECFKNRYRAIMPMWDNTSRRVNTGLIWDGSTPELYKMWLKDIVFETCKRCEEGNLDDKIIFVNAWNEWAEGAYLEPDAKWGYAYLNATREAIEEARNEVNSYTNNKGGVKRQPICKHGVSRGTPESRCVA